MPFKYVLGLEVQDKITGFKGIIRYRVEYLTGCNQYGVQPSMKEDGTVPDSIQLDETTLIVLGEGISLSFYEKEPAPAAKEQLGGPQKTISERH